jgi:Cytochrome P450
VFGSVATERRCGHDVHLGWCTDGPLNPRLQVREEQAAVRGDKNAVISGDVLYRMTYTRTVVKEILRFRPPAPMVPQVQHEMGLHYLCYSSVPWAP